MSALSRQVGICNARGLHARASAKLVKTAGAFDAEVQIVKDGQSVNALSIMGLLMLGAGVGSTVEVTAEGPEAEAALDAVVTLIEGRFDEDA